MKDSQISRRDALMGTAVLGLGLAGCGRVATEVRKRRKAEPWQEPRDAKTTRLLERMTFGWSANEDKTYRELGHQAYLDHQLEAKFEEPFELTLQLQSLDCLRVQSVELMELPRQRVIDQLQCAAILRAVYSPNQLRERMVDFWSNHFNIYSGKADGAFFKGNQEELIIREHAMDNFGEMVRKMARSPAMLVYLDNNQNYKGHPNENYARELMELHTMGVDGGYTQRDIQEVARCLTGWTMEDRFLGGLLKGNTKPKAKGSFRYIADRHDDGEKTVLGEKIAAGGGEADGDQVLSILLNHPATARYLARKLVLSFTGARHPELEKQVAAKFKTDRVQGDIPAMLRVILESDAIHQGEPILRRPFEFLCASLRRSGAITDGGTALQAHLRKMGQPMYEWPMPDGYPVDQLSWVNTVLPRWQFVSDLVHGKIPNTTIEYASLPLADKVKGGGSGMNQERRAALADVLARPEFQYM
jgi:uncharacterized protein (DUF1800 family)